MSILPAVFAWFVWCAMVALSVYLLWPVVAAMIASDSDEIESITFDDGCA